jgi:hypothetical protein
VRARLRRCCRHQASFGTGQVPQWTWNERFVGLSRPLFLYGHALVYNSESKEILLYGGRDLAGLSTQLYALSVKNAPQYRCVESIAVLSAGLCPRLPRTVWSQVGAD